MEIENKKKAKKVTKKQKKENETKKIKVKQKFWSKEAVSFKQFQKSLNYTIVFLIVACIVSGLLNYFLEFSINEQDVIKTNETISNHRPLFMVGSVVIFAILLFLFALIGEMITPLLLGTIMFIALGVGNAIKMELRSEPVYPQEFSMILKPSVLFKFFSPEKYGLTTTNIALGVGAIIIVWAALFFGVKFIVKKISKDFKLFSAPMLIIRSVLLLISSSFLYTAVNFNTPGNEIKAYASQYAEWDNTLQQYNYKNNSIILGTLYNITINHVPKPEGYSEEAMKKIGEKYQEIAEIINGSREGTTFEESNIIYIMNESFTDPSNLDGITINGGDPIPFTKEMMAKHSSGNAFSTGYGGGTSNIEFEALTGLSMWGLDPSVTVAYITLNFDRIPMGIMQTMGDKRKIAIHPFEASMYKRNEVYPQMGFEKSYFGMDKKFYPVGNTNLTSDFSAYEEVVKELVKSKEKDFIHLVTMQNHGPYRGGVYNEKPFTMEGTPDSEENSTSSYLEGTHQSDEALVKLIEQVEGMEEKVVIVFWGDHLPSLYSDEVKKNNSIQKLRETTLFMYTNFEVDKQELNDISPIYFMNHVLSLTGGKVSPFYALLGALEKELPVLNREVLMNSQGEEVKEENLTFEAKRILDDYKMVMYDMVQGKNYLKKDFFNNIK